MTSADGRCRAACSANRINSTAPIAKFGATTTPTGASFQAGSISKPVVPTTTCTPLAMPQAT
jgi:hypothetical protein